jgi:diaminopimelate epimerase
LQFDYHHYNAMNNHLVLALGENVGVDSGQQQMYVDQVFKSLVAHQIHFDQCLVVFGQLGHVWQVHIRNQDHSVAQLCLNGLWSLAYHVLTAGQSIDVLVGDITYRLTRHSEDNIEILVPKAEYLGRFTHSMATGDIDAVSVGNMHALVPVSKFLEKQLEPVALAVMHHELFQPSGANVMFYQYLGGCQVSALAYERGVGFTGACGSGACALGFGIMRRNSHLARVQVAWPSGSVMIKRASKAFQLAFCVDQPLVGKPLLVG